MGRLAWWVFAACICSQAVAGGSGSPAAEMTAEQIVAKNAAARGGLEAWRKIETMIWSGRIETGGSSAPALSYTLAMKRPNKTRFEIHAYGRTGLRVYDGTQGWKLRPVGNAPPELQPYTPEELGFAHDGQVIDGLLLDYQAKGVAVVSEGTEDVRGHKAYRLKLTLPSGSSHHVWIDAQSFLETKADRASHNGIGMPGRVSVYYQDYRTVGGLQLPFLIESGVEGGKTANRMMIERVALNPPLQEQIFSKPAVPHPHGNLGRIDAAVSRFAGRPGLIAIPGHAR